MITRAIAPAIIKEARAVLPVWAPAAVVIAAAGLTADRRVFGLGLLAYVFGASALGAYAVGHEYTHRTLSLFLAQPATRRRMLLVKLGVWIPLLGLLTGAAWLVFLVLNERPQTLEWQRASVFVTPALTSLFLAPWLTIACRSPLAGAVLALAIPGLIMVGGELLGSARYGAASIDVDRFRHEFWVRAMVVVYALSGVLSWRMFMRLEAIEGRGTEIALPNLLGRGSEVRRARPIAALALKELRLQQMSFVVAGLFVLAWLAITMATERFAELDGMPREPLIVFYMMLIAILIGSSGSAEERQFGTLESQLLVPVAAWRQWAVKIGVLFGLALALGFVLPVVLEWMHPDADDLMRPRRWPQYVAAALGLASAGLYCSTITTSGVKAMLAAVPAMMAAVLFVQQLEWLAWKLWVELVNQFEIPRAGLGARPAWVRRFLFQDLPLILTAGVTLLVLRFAFQNHRSAEIDRRRIGRQITWMAMGIAISVALLWLARRVL